MYDESSFNAFLYDANGVETLKFVSTSNDGTWRKRVIRNQLIDNQGITWNSESDELDDIFLCPYFNPFPHFFGEGGILYQNNLTKNRFIDYRPV